MSALTDELRKRGDDLSVRAADEIDFLVGYKATMQQQYPRCREIVDIVAGKVDGQRGVQLSADELAKLEAIAAEVKPDAPVVAEPVEVEPITPKG